MRIVRIFAGSIDSTIYTIFQNYSWDEFVAANLEGCQRIVEHMQP